MSEFTCDNLLQILGDEIKFDEIKSSNSTSGNGPITPKMVLYTGLRFMGGDMIKSLADVFGMCIESADCSVNIFLNAVDDCDHVDLSTNLLPQTREDTILLADQWHSRSGASGSLYGHLYPIDG